MQKMPDQVFLTFHPCCPSRPLTLIYAIKLNHSIIIILASIIWAEASITKTAHNQPRLKFLAPPGHIIQISMDAFLLGLWVQCLTHKSTVVSPFIGPCLRLQPGPVIQTTALPGRGSVISSQIRSGEFRCRSTTSKAWLLTFHL